MDEIHIESANWFPFWHWHRLSMRLLNICKLSNRNIVENGYIIHHHHQYHNLDYSVIVIIIIMIIILCECGEMCAQILTHLEINSLIRARFYCISLSLFCFTFISLVLTLSLSSINSPIVDCNTCYNDVMYWRYLLQLLKYMMCIQIHTIYLLQYHCSWAIDSVEWSFLICCVCSKYEWQN